MLRAPSFLPSEHDSHRTRTEALGMAAFSAYAIEKITELTQKVAFLQGRYNSTYTVITKGVPLLLGHPRL